MPSFEFDWPTQKLGTYLIRLPTPLNSRPLVLDADDPMHLLDRGVGADVLVVGERVKRRLRVGQVRPVKDLPDDEGEGVDVGVAEGLGPNSIEKVWFEFWLK